MTIIRLDAATLRQFEAAEGLVTLCDESGNPVMNAIVRPYPSLDEEPQFTADEWRRIMSDPRRYSTAQVLEQVRGVANK